MGHGIACSFARLASFTVGRSVLCAASSVAGRDCNAKSSSALEVPVTSYHMDRSTTLPRR